MKTKNLIAVLLLVASSACAQTTVTDYDGNIYHPVVIGNQIWMKENLNTTHYRNGNPIQLLTYSSTNTIWQNTTIGSYDTYSSAYGKLYNYYVTTDPNGVCPAGWHVPSISEWHTLIKFLDNNADTTLTSGQISATASGPLKDTQTGLWTSPNVGATNSTGFTALPGGDKDKMGSIMNQRNVAFFWSTSVIALPIFNYFNYQGFAVSLYNNSTAVAKYYWEKNFGFSIRCISDTLACTSAPTGSIQADGPTTFCAGDNVLLKAPNILGVSYQWKKNGVNITASANASTFKATATGSYTCTMSNACGTTTTNAILVTTQANSFVSLTASGATSFCAGDSVTLNATNLGSGYSVQWYRTNISMQGATNYSVVVKQPGTYKTVTKNLSNGCSRISSGSITTAVNCRMSNPDIIAVDPVNDEIPATKLGNSTETAMHLFPNPNAGSFTLEYDGIEADFEVQVLNTMGQVIYNDIIPSNDKHLKTTINLGDNMQKGIYVVRIINGENVHESKVMLQ